MANNFGINPGRLLLFVVKKNARVLQTLMDWVRWGSSAQDPATGRPLVINVPLLLVDDEADNASVDTGQQQFDEDGQPDEDHNPTRINGLIRQILFPLRRARTSDIQLRRLLTSSSTSAGRLPSMGTIYFAQLHHEHPGPLQLRGTRTDFGLDNDRDEELRRPLPLVRHVSDHETGDRVGWMPERHRNGHQPLHDGRPQVPPSLSQAIQAFILAIAAGRARGQMNEHNSMLVHVTRFTSVQAEVKRQVEEEMRRITRRLRLGEGAGTDTIMSKSPAVLGG